MGLLYVLKNDEVEALSNGKSIVFKDIFGKYVKIMKENEDWKGNRYNDAEIR